MMHLTWKNCTRLLSLIFVLGLSSSNVFSAPALADETKLYINGVSSVNSNQYCFAAQLFNPEVPKSDARIILWSQKKAEIVWSLDIPVSNGYYKNRATHCVQASNAFYAMIATETQSIPALNQTILSVVKISSSGELIKRFDLETEQSDWAHRLFLNKNNLIIVGSRENSNGRLVNYIKTLNAEDLKPIATVYTKNGAYQDNSAVKLDAEMSRLIVAGDFLDDKDTMSGITKQAASMINSQNGKYVWSTVLKNTGDVREAIAAINALGDSTILSRTSDSLRTTKIDSSGKIQFDIVSKKLLCSFDAAAAIDSDVFVAGGSCDKTPLKTIVKVSRSGQVIVFKQFRKTGTLLLSNVNQWQFVVGTSNSTMEVESGLLK